MFIWSDFWSQLDFVCVHMFFSALSKYKDLWHQEE